jgi:hypothetical protein
MVVDGPFWQEKGSSKRSGGKTAIEGVKNIYWYIEAAADLDLDSIESVRFRMGEVTCCPEMNH